MTLFEPVIQYNSKMVYSKSSSPKFTVFSDNTKNKDKTVSKSSPNSQKHHQPCKNHITKTPKTKKSTRIIIASPTDKLFSPCLKKLAIRHKNDKVLDLTRVRKLKGNLLKDLTQLSFEQDV